MGGGTARGVIVPQEGEALRLSHISGRCSPKKFQRVVPPDPRGCHTRCIVLAKEEVTTALLSRPRPGASLKTARRERGLGQTVPTAGCGDRRGAGVLQCSALGDLSQVRNAR